MIVVVLADLSHEWTRRMRAHLGLEAVVLEATATDTTAEVLQTVPADLVITEMPALTSARIAACQQIRTLAPEAVILCIAPEEVIERVRADNLPAPDLWLRPSEPNAGTEEAIRHALETAALQAERIGLEAGARPAPVIEAREQQASPAADVFHRLMSGVAGSFDLGHLLDAYVDAATQFVQCATFCLLWEQREAGRYTVYAQRGMRPEVVEGGKLLSQDALPTWYRRNRRVVTAAELADWPDRSAAVAVGRELELFCGQVAVPVMVRGRLAGILILGEKALGDSYSAGELETLFAMCNHVALAAESIELHQELQRSKAYTDRIVRTMGAGLITLGPDQRISLCNPYAAQVLGLEQHEVQGADLRCLPSPLGDYLYATLESPDNAVAGEEVTIQGGKGTVRVSTSALLDESGTPLGSVMLLDDISAEIELTKERSRSERLDVLTRIVGRIAHEVKNPLTAVKTYAELIGDRGPDEDLAQFWSRTVTPEIEHLDELLSNLVRMVEPPEPSFEVARIEDLLEEVVRQLHAGEASEDAMFDLEVAEAVPAVALDPHPTREALRHLLRWVAGPESAPVHIGVAPATDNHDSIMVTMRRLARHNGSFDADAIFDPLYVMEHLDADLGPVIAQKIISGQNGSVEAACENGHVTMRIMLPSAGQRASRQSDGLGHGPEVS